MPYPALPSTLPCPNLPCLGPSTELVFRRELIPRCRWSFVKGLLQLLLTTLFGVEEVDALLRVQRLQVRSGDNLFEVLVSRNFLRQSPEQKMAEDRKIYRVYQKKCSYIL